jgi:hypothetical protein
MSESPFDPTHAVTFDLAHGLVHLEDAPKRLLVPADALAALAATATSDARAAFAKALGGPLGTRALRRLGDTKTTSVEVVVDHLGGELALAGLGTLSIERWGRAMILVVDQSPLAGSVELLGGVLAAALGAATGRDVTTVSLMQDATRSRFLVASASTAERARGLLSSGTSWGDTLVRLHEGGAS